MDDNATEEIIEIYLCVDRFFEHEVRLEFLDVRSHLRVSEMCRSEARWDYGLGKWE